MSPWTGVSKEYGAPSNPRLLEGAANLGHASGDIQQSDHTLDHVCSNTKTVCKSLQEGKKEWITCLTSGRKPQPAAPSKKLSSIQKKHNG